MKNYGLMLVCLISLCAASAARAESLTPQKGDTWVTAKTKIALFADKRVRGSEVNVETKSGVVMLRGKVDTDEAKAAAEQLASHIEGAAVVKNELQVVPRAVRALVDHHDAMLSKRVKKALKAIKHASIGVKVNDGVVTLNGTTETLSDSATASWSAWLVEGVYAVKNDITSKN